MGFTGVGLHYIVGAEFIARRMEQLRLRRDRSTHIMVKRIREWWVGAVLTGLTALVGPALPAHAQITDLQTAVIAFSNALDFVIGSTGNQNPGNNEAVPCPGAVPGGTEDVYDFGQDGVPDYAQMALVEALYKAGDPQVVDAVNHMAHALKTRTITVSSNQFRGTALEGFEFLVNLLRLNLPQLLETVITTLGLIDLPDGIGATPAERTVLFNQAIDGITLWGCVDNPENLLKTVCIEETTGVIFGVLVRLYDNERANLNSRVGGHAPLGDGTTVLDRWNETEALVPAPPLTKVLATDNPSFLARVDAFIHIVRNVIPGDINGDGTTNAVDVQLVINAALGLSVPSSTRPDINADGAVNAVDVQLVINAALGMDIAAQL